MGKRCLWCGKPVQGKDAAKKIFCSRQCYMIGSRIENPSKATQRKWAQRHIPAKLCARCGGDYEVQRHHEDISSKVAAITALCKHYHAKRDVELGKWGGTTGHRAD